MQIVSPPAEERRDDLTPREIVERLDAYIVGQSKAKRAVAVAIRNRWRRRRLDPEMAREVMPKNILMIGPTGVGKTEIARRLAELVGAPFIKVEASKFTEVGYHGRDVESMIRELVKVAIAQVEREATARVAPEARAQAEERLLDRLLPPPEFSPAGEEAKAAEERRRRTREKLRASLRAGGLDEREVEVTTSPANPVGGMLGSLGGDEMVSEMQELVGRMMPQPPKTRRVRVPEAMRLLEQEEARKLLDDEAVAREGIERAEQDGIVFLDEIDKVAGSDRSDGPDVSREGVQRDLLPIVEGSTVGTKHGAVRTDHMLFIAAGAFHGKKPSDLIPELQGRFPIRVELEALTRADFERILTHPKNALTKQYELLLGTEGVRIRYEDEALALLAEMTARLNETTQNIGARRLHTVMERLFEEISFDAPERGGEKITVDPALVRERLAALVEDEDLSRYIL